MSFKSFLAYRVFTPLRLKLLRKLRISSPNGLNVACFSQDLIGNHIIEDGLYEFEELKCLRKFLNQTPNVYDSVCLDIGANIGNHSLFFAHLFKKVISFEPNGLALRLLEANVMMNGIRNVTVLDYGLSDTDETLTMQVNLKNLGASTLIYDSWKVSSALDLTTTIISLKVGDEVLPALLQGERVGFIKIDVEGFETNVLKGIHQTILQHRPILMIEALLRPGFPRPTDVFKLLRELGYTAFYEFVHPPAQSSYKLIRKVERVFLGYDLEACRLKILEDRDFTVLLAAGASN